MTLTAGDGAWSGLRSFESSDGPLEEPAMAASDNEIVVAWQEDGRRRVGLSWTEGFGGEECLARRQHYGEVVGTPSTGRAAFGSRLSRRLT